MDSFPSALHLEAPSGDFASWAGHTRGTGVVDAYAQYLAAAYPWQWFVTMTSCKRTHPEAIYKTFRFAVSLMTRHYLGRRPRLHDRIVSVVALERHKNGNPHLHAIMWHRQDLNSFSGSSRSEFKATLENLSGFSKVEKPHQAGRVSRYCAKYLLKGGEIHFSPAFGIHGAITPG